MFEYLIIYISNTGCCARARVVVCVVVASREGMMMMRIVIYYIVNRVACGRRTILGILDRVLVLYSK